MSGILFLFRGLLYISCLAIGIGVFNYFTGVPFSELVIYYLPVMVIVFVVYVVIWLIHPFIGD